MSGSAATAPGRPIERLLDEHAATVLGSGVAAAAAVVVTDRDGTLISRSYGASDDALWPIASIGKAFAAVIALRSPTRARSTCTRRCATRSPGSPSRRSRRTTC